MTTEKIVPTSYLGLLNEECATMAKKFKLNSENTEILRNFITDTAMKAWRNGRAVGWIRGKNEAVEAARPAGKE